MIKVLKASAGSGKTFRLAKKYIELLLSSPDRYAYRHILAVTFTNKATEEMKSRILKELDILAKDPDRSGYIKDFEGRFGTRGQISRRAGEILLDILHDYSLFSVSTIDKFFQQTLRAFAREIGRFSSYQVELDKDSLVKESVDRILDSLTEDDKVMLGWLTGDLMEQLQNEGRYSLEKNLYEAALALKSDEHRVLVDANGIDEEKVYSKEHLTQVRKACAATRESFAKEVKATALQALAILEEAGVDPSLSNRGFMSRLTLYTGDVLPKAPTESWLAKASDSSKWFSRQNSYLLPSVEGPLAPVLDAFCALFGEPYRVYLTAGILESQLYSLGIAGELYREFDALLKEKNVLSLDDSNVLLRRIIGESDAPFVYEKTGVKYENFLLDEFQDTSVVQWENFAPLLAESEASGRENLVVGDVKQSIYRWRGSDWNLLGAGVKDRFPSADDGESLQSNWRSLASIVNFNNAFFEYASAVLGRQSGSDSIPSIYSDVKQSVHARDGAPGRVRVSFCNPATENELICASIEEAVAAGASYGDIAVLVRRNSEGSDVASFLIDKGIPVVSDDSLMVKSSVAVRQLVSLLSLVDNPSDGIGSYLAKDMGIALPTSFSSLYDLAEEILRSMSGIMDLSGETLYIQSFMDELRDWTATWGNNLAGFLDYWQDSALKISSPEGSSAVRVMTIHKSKGLEFPCVIFPYAEKVPLFRDSEKWTCPDLEGTSLSEAGGAAYRVNLSKSSCSTLFSKDFEREMLLQYTDNLNIFYVAMTRAVKELHVIAAEPDDKCKSSVGSDGYAFSRFSQLLWHFLQEKALFMGMEATDDGFSYGTAYDFSAMQRDSAVEDRMDLGWNSVPIGDRLRLKCDSFDYFTPEGTSNRLKGIVMHDILSRVKVPGDLAGAVREAVLGGDIPREEAEAYLEFLSSRIASRAEWFPDDPSPVHNEEEIIDAHGGLNRPDRVVTCGNTAIIIDYKFGEPSPSYHRQLRRYASLYRDLGYSEVSAWIWYVVPDTVEEVSL